MKSIFSSTAFAEHCRIVEYPDGFIASAGIDENSYQIDCDHFKEQLKSTFLNGIHLEERSVFINEPFSIEVKHDFPFLKMQFELEGYSCFHSDLSSVPNVEILSNHHQLFYLPEVNGRLNYNQSRSTLEIKLTLDFLNRTFNGDLAPLKHFGKAIQANAPKLLSSCQMPITIKMRELIHDIKSCAYTGLMKKVFLECKITELLLMQVDQFYSEKDQHGDLKAKDTSRLYQVRDLIKENLEQPKTILQLSEIAGINDFKLKKEFKQVFGDTLFGYLTKVRLEHARNLILSGCKINEVSARVGYRHQQHFTVAFKRHYGFLPGSLLAPKARQKGS